MDAPAQRLRQRLVEALPDAAVLARAPGRVNLIGEHTDYNGFPVLPMAIDRTLQVAAAARPGGEVVVRNLESERYPGETVPLPGLATREPRGNWVDYVVAALRARPPAAGLELLVGGDVPPEAGLSSSSALVVASLLALGGDADRLELADRARRAERYVGTLSGGMDQAISLLARPGHALRIDFEPLRVEPVPLPGELGIVVADSGVPAPKSGSARRAYNDRVRQCAAAARALGAPPGGLLADVPAGRRSEAGELAEPLLRRRARFVFAEARRVDAAVDALRRGDLEALGGLVDASHAGLRDDYEVSHPAVDELVTRARRAGALGARVVGAGFGGCIVALCRRRGAGELVDALGPRAWHLEAAGPAVREELE